MRHRHPWRDAGAGARTRRRIIAIDFWDKGPRYQRAMLWVIVTLWVLLMVPGTYFMLLHTAESLFGSTP